MKLDLHITFEPGVRDVNLSIRNAQINTVEHDHGFEELAGDIVGLHVNISVDGARFGRQKSLLTVKSDRCGFTFAPLDLATTGTILLPAYGVTITQRGAMPVSSRGLSKLQAIEHAAEESFEQSACATQDVPCPTLLGLGLDYRHFLVETDMQTIRIVNSVRNRLASVRIPVGRGKGTRTDLHRRLDQGSLPILRGQRTDEDVRYDAIMFTTLMGLELRDEHFPGTPFLVAEEGLGMPHTAEQAARREEARREMLASGQPALMLCYRLQATNISFAPAFAFLYQPRLMLLTDQEQPVALNDGAFLIGDDVRGTAYFEGQPWPESQIVILLAPGETVQAEYRLVHEPIALSSVDRLCQTPFDQLLTEARSYWLGKLKCAATIHVPEQRIDEMLRAGLLHLYTTTYGQRSGTLAPAVGVYSPIGSESSPIIQFYDSMGWPDIAAQCLQYFLDKQHPDGRFQNFGGYMLETGAALYTMGEHYRYTRDDAWVRDIKDRVAKACEWIIRHHREDTPKGQLGAGLIQGKVADPEDYFRQYMLNAYQYLGLARAAEMLRGIDLPLAGSLAAEAETYRHDIRIALAESMIRSPLVPLGDGRWVPSCAPWVEAIAPDAFALEGQVSYTHEAVYARDSLLGPIHAIFAEIVAPHEQMADFLVESHYEHMCFDGIAFSQPYYSRHPVVHLRRGEIKAFLRSFYRAMAALADRETYTFWEHLFGVSPHKTHEEGWFLMEARSMLYAESDYSLEKGGELHLLPGSPRSYLRHGQHVEVRRAQSYFGELSFHVASLVDDGYMDAAVECPQGRQRGLKSILLRLPHPEGRKVKSVDGDGQYDARSESVSFAWPDTGSARLTVRF